MYCEKGRELTVEEVREAILDAVESGKKWHRTAYREFKREVSPEWLQKIARQLVELNSAMIKGRKVFAVCDREPRGNLDSGRHYYSVHYVTEDGDVRRFWVGEFTPFLGGEAQNRHRGVPYWVYSSGAIGMSRVLDATDGIFNFLRRLGGCYAQLDVI